MEDESEVHYIHNDVEEMFNPIDAETIKVKEMIKKRRPTPYSKSTKKSDEESQSESSWHQGDYQNNPDDYHSPYKQVRNLEIYVKL